MTNIITESNQVGPSLGIQETVGKPSLTQEEKEELSRKLLELIGIKIVYPRCRYRSLEEEGREIKIDFRTVYLKQEKIANPKVLLSKLKKDILTLHTTSNDLKKNIRSSYDRLNITGEDERLSLFDFLLTYKLHGKVPDPELQERILSTGLTLEQPGWLPWLNTVGPNGNIRHSIIDSEATIMLLHTFMDVIEEENFLHMLLSQDHKIEVPEVSKLNEKITEWLGSCSFIFDTSSRDIILFQESEETKKVLRKKLRELSNEGVRNKIKELEYRLFFDDVELHIGDRVETRQSICAQAYEGVIQRLSELD